MSESSVPAPLYSDSDLCRCIILEIGFTFVVTADEPCPPCVVCGNVLANDILKPCKLRRHLEMRHTGLKDKPLNIFKRKFEALNQQKAL